MPNKPAKTFHPLAMAKSLQRQNEVVGLLILNISTYARMSDEAPVETLRELIKKAGEQAEEARRVLWPEDGDEA